MCRFFNKQLNHQSYRQLQKTKSSVKTKTNSNTRAWIPTDSFWFPKPENCHDSSKLTKVWKIIYDTLLKLQQDEKLDPRGDKENGAKFFSKFDWTASIFSHEQKKHAKLLVKYHKISARHILEL